MQFAVAVVGSAWMWLRLAVAGCGCGCGWSRPPILEAALVQFGKMPQLLENARLVYAKRYF